MANSAIRIPIPGSIIDAVNAVDGDMLIFNQSIGQNGAFVNFKPLIQNLQPFTGQSVLDFYVSLTGGTGTSWENATVRGMTLAAAQQGGSGNPISTDIRLGINLEEGEGRPSHTLEVAGDICVWGRGTKGGDMVGTLDFYNAPTGTEPPSLAPGNLLFKTPIKFHTTTELNDVQNTLRTGRLLVRNADNKQTYFARLEDILTPGTGIQVTDNTVSLAEFCEINCPTGFTIRMDTDRTGAESDEFRVVERFGYHTDAGGVADFPLLRLVRQHGDAITWNGTASAFQIGDPDNNAQTSRKLKMGIGTGNRFLPGGMMIENLGSYGCRYARLFGPVAANPADIIITGTAGHPETAIYHDISGSASATEVAGTGRFGFLPGFASMITGGLSGGFANPGSFVSGFLNRDADGGGIKIKACDNNNDEYALFMENGELGYLTSATGGSNIDLQARHFAIQDDVTSTNPNDQYKNILANDAPVFSVRAASGDTFVRGFLSMPFLPGINSDLNQAPLVTGGLSTGDVTRTTEVDSNKKVTINKYEFCASCGSGGIAQWVLKAQFELPKGTLYSDANGNVKIARGGPNVLYHGLNGVTSW